LFEEKQMDTSRGLIGKTAFVSGSGQNIGRAIALALAEGGCNVVVNGARDRDAAERTADGVRAAGAKALVAMGDVGDAEAVAAIADAALGAFGRIDILVNNAAVRPHKPFLETADEDWTRVVDTALTGAFRLSRAFLPGMVDAGWGRIVNFAGMKAIRGYFEGAPISAAKHGVWGLTKALSEEFAPKGITANVISPGQIRKDSETQDDPRRVATIPAGSMGRPEDIGAVVAFLCSDGARFVTGQMISVNGGEET
jgi:3-oxoacyl-[acyl-carrier protein] reductase